MEDLLFNTFQVSLLCGVIFLIAAMVTHYLPPKKINPLYGYRTNSSMKSQERWDFAQRFSTSQMIKGSIVLIAVSLLGYFIPLAENAKFIIGIALLVMMVAWLFITTEKAIRKQFQDTH